MSFAEVGWLEGYFSVLLDVDGVASGVKIFLTTCLSIYLSNHLFIYVSMYLSIYVYIYLSICPSVSLVVYLYLSFRNVLIYTYIYLLQVHSSIYLYAYLSIHISIRMTVFLSLSFRLYLFIYLSISCRHEFIYLSTSSSIYQYD